jgi:cytochrome c oxidase cbb3-type subunit 3
MSDHDSNELKSAGSQEPKLLDHNYDGIQEFDNLLPNWWLMTFLGTIIFGFIYFIHYNFGGAQTQVQELHADLDALPKATEKVFDEATLAAQVDQPESLKKGAAVFASKCSACHGPQGQGIIGPNLTDNYWLHGKGLRKDIAQTVTKGVLDKGMPSWSGLISDDEILQVVGYVYSLRGTHPQNPKPPQGEEVKNQ